MTFTVTDDAVVDPNEVFDVNLATSTSFATVRPDRSSAVVTIDDNDEGEFHQKKKKNQRILVISFLCRGGGCLLSNHLQCE